MHTFTAIKGKGQTMVLIAVAAIVLVAFVGLAIDGGAAYSLRRQTQNAADGASIAGTWVMADYNGSSPKADILRKVNQYAEANGIVDTNGVAGDAINDNVLAYFVDFDGNRLSLGSGEDWEIHAGPDVIPGNARGIEAVTTISQTTFFVRAVGVQQVAATASATSRYQPDGGILPIAVNEYWYGSQGNDHFCPYDHCGEPYSFVRNPTEAPPFSSTDGGTTWERNFCADPYNENTCQGPYEGYGENYGKAFALMGQDAYPNFGSRQPRSAVVIDYRYDALEDGGKWHALIDNDTWLHDVQPIPQGHGMDAMSEVIKQGGYSKVPLPASAVEPPPEEPFIHDWGYCWDTPEGPDTCFNYPMNNHGIPYCALQFLYGTEASKMAKTMYDDGNYIDNRYAPGERVVIMVYNSYPGDKWGGGGTKNQDTAVVVGYFGAVIVGYGLELDRDCGNGTPGDWTSYASCIHCPGNCNPTTVYGIAAPSAPLTLDPSRLLDEFLPKKITLIR